MRFQSGESDVISRITARNSAALRRDSARRGYALLDAGPSLEYGFLFFNLNDSVKPSAAWRSLAFRRAVSLRSIATRSFGSCIRVMPIRSLASSRRETRLGFRRKFPCPIHSIERAREFLRADGFKWSREGALLDSEGRNVRFSIVASSSNPERAQIATLIQADLKPLGIEVDVVQLEFNSLIARVTTYARLRRMHFRPQQRRRRSQRRPGCMAFERQRSSVASRANEARDAWEAEIDALMKQQLITPRYEERKRIFDRVHEIAAQNLSAHSAGQPSRTGRRQTGPG